MFYKNIRGTTPKVICELGIKFIFLLKNLFNKYGRIVKNRCYLSNKFGIFFVGSVVSFWTATRGSLRSNPWVAEQQPVGPRVELKQEPVSPSSD